MRIFKKTVFVVLMSVIMIMQNISLANTVSISEENHKHSGFIAPIDNNIVPVDAIHIRTAAELASIGGEQSFGKYYVLNNDINLTSEWIPIENFLGTFDGNGYSVRACLKSIKNEPNEG